jgi:glyoxylase-like metal-dependent hydrolase (beta-lactamase superfamily II)
MTNAINLALMFVVLSLPLTAWGQDSETAPSVETTPLTGNLYLLQGKGGNVVASVGEDGILLIDTDYGEYATAYHGALKSLADGEVKASYVINTHWHGDHVGSNAYWGERGAVIMAHGNVYARMSTRQEMKAFDRVVEPSPKVALPVVTYGDAIALHFNGDDIEVQHAPRSHTDGDSVVYFSAHNVVHMGDLFFKDRYPFVDMGSGGNVLSFTDNVAKVLARVDEDTVIVPGHGGGVANRADLQRYYDMLVSSTATVKAKLAKGMSVAAIAAEGVGDDWVAWDSGFISTEAWVGFIAASL